MIFRCLLNFSNLQVGALVLAMVLRVGDVKSLGIYSLQNLAPRSSQKYAILMLQHQNLSSSQTSLSVLGVTVFHNVSNFCCRLILQVKKLVQDNHSFCLEKLGKMNFAKQ